MMKDGMFDDIRKKLEFLEEEAPGGLWEGIESSLPPAAAPLGRKNVRSLRWLWMPAAAAAAALAVFLLLPAREETEDGSLIAGLPEQVAGEESRTEDSQQIVWEEVDPSEVYSSSEAGTLAQAVPVLEQEPAEECSLPVPGDRNTLSQTPLTAEGKSDASETLAVAEGKNDTSEALAVADGKSDASETSAVAEGESEAAAASAVVQPESAVSSASSDGKPDSSDWEDDRRATMELLPDDFPDFESESAGKRNRFAALRPQSISAGASGFMTQSRMENTYSPVSTFNTLNSKAPSGDGIGQVVPASDRPSGEPVQVQSYALKTDAKHYRPVTFSVLAKWQFTETLGLESGLSWTMLSSRFTTSSATSQIADQQTLQYIGIPLNMTFSFLDTRLFTIYAAMGGMVEKCVDGRVKHSEYVSDKQLLSYVDKVSVTPLQWSVSGGAGIQANFSDNLAFFAEPGLSYHFRNESQVGTIYREHPLDFRFSFGFRVTFNR
ncbi:MAG: outer membrane beta-barrel protein [Bacteroidales bacterium]|uniref:outer membrane protein n=1 Tax=Candidatus Cryptobacteroides sp. TaxID=2952915 RepID=UPI002A91F5D1|nr:outer membrane beta-barrel protein [Candidatus Cryptobacteroides sp.]MDD7135983.1 outer membrane beta-barrel protein [Bacteroidales bacterium]MDY5567352.1 outer membrane beta-barrel protein [Candidatus Cryptobacteroides sp.]